MYNENVVFEQLKKESICVLHSKSRCLAYETYGAVRMAFELKAITSERLTSLPICLSQMELTSRVSRACVKTFINLTGGKMPK